jgi:hypothetical protein
MLHASLWAIVKMKDVTPMTPTPDQQDAPIAAYSP